MKAFLAAFDVLPGFLWALLLAGALALVGVKQVQWLGVRVQLAQANDDFSEFRAAAAKSAQLAEIAARKEEARRTDLQRKALDESNTETRAALADAADARSTHERLRQQAQRAADAARAAREDSATLRASAAAYDPIGVLAEVLIRIDGRAGRLAEIADASRIAGQLCERSYDALIVAD